MKIVLFYFFALTLAPLEMRQTTVCSIVAFLGNFTQIGKRWYLHL